jgi:hypothetical protein
MNEYPELLDELSKISNKFSFVLRSDFKMTDSIKTILDLFERFLLLETEVESWPGTVLFYGGKARIFYYSFNQETLSLLKEACNDLYGWLYPEKPEDLCFYNNEEVVFTSISHERDSFFVADEDTMEPTPTP